MAATHAPNIDAFLQALDARLHREIDRTPVAEPARQLIDAGGKRLRARLLWWSACAAASGPFDPTHEPVVRAAAAIELAHLGSLIHDDIVDAGDMRRGVITLHRSHGARAATDAGAALAHLANALVAPLGLAARRAVRRALLATCRGQIRELAVPFVPVGAAGRFAIMQEKTGAFFELAAALGAIAADAPPHARAAVCRFARRFGVAFQIADDVLDLAGDPRELGRANGADLRDGVLTLPILLGLEREPAIAEHLTRIRTRPESSALAACAAAITRAGGVDDARTLATTCLERATRALAPLGQGPAVRELAALADAALARGIRPAVPCFETPVIATHAPGTPPAPTFPTVIDRDATLQLGARLTHTIEWFHPGLASMVAARSRGATVREHRRRVRAELRAGRRWSLPAMRAADGIALAHALAGTDDVTRDPVHTLAMVDALHCAAIGFLNDGADPDEHETLSLRARNVTGTPSAPRFVPAQLRATPLAEHAASPLA